MGFFITRGSVFCILVILFVFVGGCGEVARKDMPADIKEPIDLEISIGELAELYITGRVAVIGFGIVAGLNGSGSSECPPGLRSELIKYIQQQVTDGADLDANEFIDSKDTAVVQVYGTLPADAGKRFDVKVAPLVSTQTTSLEGGTLYPTELKLLSRVSRFNQYSKTAALAHGPVFINKLDGDDSPRNSGFILGGAEAVAVVNLRLRLFEPNFYTASAIRNRINERFGVRTAIAQSAEAILINIPKEYKDKKFEFLAMVKTLYLSTAPQSQRNRINILIDELITSEDKLSSEIALAAIGKASVGKLSQLLDSDVELIRFHASRCLLTIGEQRGLPVLRTIAYDRDSSYRIGAIQGIGKYAERNSAMASLSSILGDAEFDVAFAAYEQLRRLGDISISQELVADFIVEQVMHPGPKRIFVRRSGSPRVVLFGAPIYCEKDLFIESEDGSIVINAPAGAKYVSIMRRHPRRPKLVGPFKSGYRVVDVIKTLSESARVNDASMVLPGLGVSYSDMLALLQQMTKHGDIRAEFIAGKMSVAGVNLEKKPVDDR